MSPLSLTDGPGTESDVATTPIHRATRSIDEVDLHIPPFAEQMSAIVQDMARLRDHLKCISSEIERSRGGKTADVGVSSCEAILRNFRAVLGIHKSCAKFCTSEEQSQACHSSPEPVPPGNPPAPDSGAQ